jgi:hypothetical protein
MNHDPSLRATAAAIYDMIPHMRFQTLPRSRNWLQLSIAEQCPPDHPSPGDVRFAISLRFGNGRDQTFYARTHAWIHSSELRAFSRDLELLDRTRQGTATLNSMSPGELVLTIAFADSAGHPVVRGQTGRHILNVKQEYLWCCLPFEIAFDPSLLPPLAEEFQRLAAFD